VCTAFVARGFLDGYSAFKCTDHLNVANRACDFLLGDINRVGRSQNIGLSYSPLDHIQVHNASALGAALLFDVGVHLNRPDCLSTAGVIFDGLLSHQDANGAWVYGTARHHQWIDGFHTGYILQALAALVAHDPAADRCAALERGLHFYREHLLIDNWRPRNRADDNRRSFEVHAAAQALLILSHPSLSTTADRQSAARLLSFLLSGRHPLSGLFPDFWRRGRWYFSVANGFLRWTQAWMARGLSSSARSFLS
jgi:hypothetical protein